MPIPNRVNFLKDQNFLATAIELIDKRELVDTFSNVENRSFRLLKGKVSHLHNILLYFLEIPLVEENLNPGTYILVISILLSSNIVFLVPMKEQEGGVERNVGIPITVSEALPRTSVSRGITNTSK